MQAHRIPEGLASIQIVASMPTDAASMSQDSPLLAMAPGPTRIVRSSIYRSWRGIRLEEHHTSPGERAANSIDQDVISMFMTSPARFEYRAVHGHFVAGLNRPGTIMITPRGLVPEMRLHTPATLLHCALGEDLLRGVVGELDRPPMAEPVFRPALRDTSIQRIMGLLAEELEADWPLGTLYVDSLAHAFAARYLSLQGASGMRPESPVSALPARILTRVKEKIHANLDADLTLEALAEESGYSRAHFLRMFRAATGLTPHQYVLGLRLSRAQECLRQRDASIIDIAVACGFSSQSHMTSVFRHRLETTPGEYRRNA